MYLSRRKKRLYLFCLGLYLVLFHCMFVTTAAASESQAGGYNYVYDNLGRIKYIKFPSGLFEEYIYDKNGNLISKNMSINGSFEKDENGNNLPDFWEVNWRNGTSSEPFAGLAPYDPVDGANVYRLFNGKGDRESYQYVLSNAIPVVGGKSYEVRAMMKYTLQDGGTAGMHIIQLDANGKEVGYDAQSYNSGGWKWHNHSQVFVAEPSAKSVLIRFAVGGEDSAYMDLDTVSFKEININGSFEKDENGNNLPDFWEVNWRNGTSSGPFAGLAPYDPVDGANVYRLFNGKGDPESYQYVLSNAIPVVGGKSYEVRAMMKYTLQSGGTAGMHIIQLDANGKEVGYDAQSYNNGGWKWHNHSQVFVAKPDAKSVLIRFAVGGEDSAYMDLDTVSFKEININGSFEKDENGNNLPDFWEVNWRNGTSSEPFAGLVPYDPVDGVNVYRLFNGKGDPESYQYVLSNATPVVGGKSYEVRAMMKYTLQGGGTAGMHIIQLDANGKEVGYDAQSYNNGGWKWHNHSQVFVAKPNAKSVLIRFAVGGEDSAYMDLDTVSFKEI
ncbi:hypothetical protein [Paenibacillus oleatilyticus]|uniref:Uncharacterized protein n=1 Tax=Paenibacillus oleatilyticus TaxID=2594886 RepID=A0ABV4VB77_9BACL